MYKLDFVKKKRQLSEDYWQITAYIGLKSYETDENGRILISPDMLTDIEVHEWADMLIEELKEIKKKASKLKWDNHPQTR